MSDDKKPPYELKTVKVEELEPNSWNPQTQNDATFTRLREEIRKLGYCMDPIEVVPLESGKYRIIGGEHRWKACLAEGIADIPIISLTDKKWADEDLQRFVTVRLNTIRGSIDPEKFAKLYNEMADKYGADALQSLMGFTDAKGFQRLLGTISKGLGGLSKETKKKFDENAKEAKTVEELTSILNELFAKYGDTMDQNFLVFTHGKKQHIYVAMDMKTKRAMEKVTEYCKLTKEDINTVMAPVIEQCMKVAEEKMANAYSDESPVKS